MSDRISLNLQIKGDSISGWHLSLRGLEDVNDREQEKGLRVCVLRVNSVKEPNIIFSLLVWSLSGA
jgi:hypothetical protein